MAPGVMEIRLVGVMGRDSIMLAAMIRRGGCGVCRLTGPGIFHRSLYQLFRYCVN
jgi:hypothetical protein